jgi:hypothetical protein
MLDLVDAYTLVLHGIPIEEIPVSEHYATVLVRFEKSPVFERLDIYFESLSNIRFVGLLTSLGKEVLYQHSTQNKQQYFQTCSISYLFFSYRLSEHSLHRLLFVLLVQLLDL